MAYVFLGPPGSGKDTQADKIAALLGVPTVGTGDIMREYIKSGSDLGEELNSYVSKGNWPPPELVLRVFEDEIVKPKYAKGFVATGLVRSIEQLHLFDELFKKLGIEIDRVVHFDLDKEAAMQRLVSQEKDTGGSRPDSTEEAKQGRYKSYVDTIEPILDEYEKRGILLRVDAAPSIEEIFENLKSKLGLGDK